MLSEFLKGRMDKDRAAVGATSAEQPTRKPSQDTLTPADSHDPLVRAAARRVGPSLFLLTPAERAKRVVATSCTLPVLRF
jgi:hypothetical protein